VGHFFYLSQNDRVIFVFHGLVHPFDTQRSNDPGVIFSVSAIATPFEMRQIK
jgi:hypothetical protein